MGIVSKNDKETTFPYVGEHSTGLKVLFVRYNHDNKTVFGGYVVDDPDENYAIGEYSDIWIASQFTPIEYTVHFDMN